MSAAVSDSVARDGPTAVAPPAAADALQQLQQQEALIAALQAQLAAKESDCNTAASLGQMLLSQVEALKARVDELEQAEADAAAAAAAQAAHAAEADAARPSMPAHDPHSFEAFLASNEAAAGDAPAALSGASPTRLDRSLRISRIPAPRNRPATAGLAASLGASSTHGAAAPSTPLTAVASARHPATPQPPSPSLPYQPQQRISQLDEGLASSLDQCLIQEAQKLKLHVAELTAERDAWDRDRKDMTRKIRSLTKEQAQWQRRQDAAQADANRHLEASEETVRVLRTDRQKIMTRMQSLEASAKLLEKQLEDARREQLELQREHDKLLHRANEEAHTYARQEDAWLQERQHLLAELETVRADLQQTNATLAKTLEELQRLEEAQAAHGLTASLSKNSSRSSATGLATESIHELQMRIATLQSSAHCMEQERRLLQSRLQHQTEECERLLAALAAAQQAAQRQPVFHMETQTIAAVVRDAGAQADPWEMHGLADMGTSPAPAPSTHHMSIQPSPSRFAFMLPLPVSDTSSLDLDLDELNDDDDDGDVDDRDDGIGARPSRPSAAAVLDGGAAPVPSHADAHVDAVAPGARLLEADGLALLEPSSRRFSRADSLASSTCTYPELMGVPRRLDDLFASAAADANAHADGRHVPSSGSTAEVMAPVMGGDAAALDALLTSAAAVETPHADSAATLPTSPSGPVLLAKSSEPDVADAAVLVDVPTRSAHSTPRSRSPVKSTGPLPWPLSGRTPVDYEDRVVPPRSDAPNGMARRPTLPREPEASLSDGASFSRAQSVLRDAPLSDDDLMGSGRASPTHSASMNQSGSMAAAEHPVESLTHAMIGSWFQKYSRNGRHVRLRYFWINPYARTLHWAAKPPSQGKRNQATRYAFIESLQWNEAVHASSTRNYPPSREHALVFMTPGRKLELVATNWGDHRRWIAGITLLLESTHSQAPLTEQFAMAMGARRVSIGTAIHERASTTTAPLSASTATHTTGAAGASAASATATVAPTAPLPAGDDRDGTHGVASRSPGPRSARLHPSLSRSTTENAHVSSKTVASPSGPKVQLVASGAPLAASTASANTGLPPPARASTTRHATVVAGHAPANPNTNAPPPLARSMTRRPSVAATLVASVFRFARSTNTPPTSDPPVDAASAASAPRGKHGRAMTHHFLSPSRSNSGHSLAASGTPPLAVAGGNGDTVSSGGSVFGSGSDLLSHLQPPTRSALLAASVASGSPTPSLANGGATAPTTTATLGPTGRRMGRQRSLTRHLSASVGILTASLQRGQSAAAPTQAPITPAMVPQPPLSTVLAPTASAERTLPSLPEDMALRTQAPLVASPTDDAMDLTDLAPAAETPLHAPVTAATAAPASPSMAPTAARSRLATTMPFRRSMSFLGKSATPMPRADPALAAPAPIPAPDASAARGPRGPGSGASPGRLASPSLDAIPAGRRGMPAVTFSTPVTPARFAKSVASPPARLGSGSPGRSSAARAPRPRQASVGDGGIALAGSDGPRLPLAVQMRRQQEIARTLASFPGAFGVGP
ncbi:hypothetical protein CXG81DRAFT_27813 [Caulochytrium protostelioides]|uniref:Pleckstrin homology domain-containing protein n=1 Tax=Caulochytrium protostelioides TaxID=1555241 RepID=A0A4P9X343_9FUNG|nr:hypothetical protein CXG81DRAFT_27813 [Caulochytrium protostelioides]|eukprot:RKO99420.1 hypothetical protein CXG81DRAFT_27813 [Caulochytrium protostelioides]